MTVCLTKYFEKLEVQVGTKLQSLISSVVQRLLPSVIANPPREYLRLGKPSDQDIEALLQRDIEAAISIKTLLKKHKIKKVYKDIAYQSVKSNHFQEELKKSLVKNKVTPTRMAQIFKESNAVLEKGGHL